MTAAAALADLGDLRAVEPLTKALGGPKDIRKAAAEALGQLGDLRAVTPLLGAMNDAEPSVRAAVFAALGDLGDARAVEPLITALGEWNIGNQAWWRSRENLPASAAEALGRLGDPRAVEPLIAALGFDSSYRARGTTGGDDSRRDGEGGIRSTAAQALGRLGGARAVEALITALGDWRVDVRKAAAEALEGLAETGWLQLIHGDGDDLKRLGGSSDPRAIEPLVKALGGWQWDARKAAAEALADL